MREELEKKIMINYLLGNIDDEAQVDALDERFFVDDEFRSEIELLESELIDDYLAGALEPETAELFESRMNRNSARAQNVEFHKQLKANALRAVNSERNNVRNENGIHISIWQQLLNSPKFVPAMTAVVILFVVVTIGWILFAKSRTNPDKSVAELANVYVDSRPIEARIEGFNYGAYVRLRGGDVETSNRQETKVVVIGEALKDAVKVDPNWKNHKNLGVFYLAQGQYDDALVQFDATAAPAKDSGEIFGLESSAYYEKAMDSTGGQRIELLNMALEKSNQAIASGDSSPTILFNRALILENLPDKTAAIGAWNAFIKVSDGPKWTEEANSHLSRLE